MTIRLIYVGKTFQDFIQEGCNEFEKRLKRYCKLEVVIIPDDKNLAHIEPSQLKKNEALKILKCLKTDDYLIVLDEKGKQFTSVEFAQSLQKKMNQGIKNLCFVVGGAYGFDETVYSRANEQLGFSKMTFSHQMIRLFLAEQIYRAHTILKNEPYHNE